MVSVTAQGNVQHCGRPVPTEGMPRVLQAKLQTAPAPFLWTVLSNLEVLRRTPQQHPKSLLEQQLPGLPGLYIFGEEMLPIRVKGCELRLTFFFRTGILVWLQ